MSFAAKVDLWFLVLFYGSGLVMWMAAPLVWKRTGGRGAAVLLSILGLLFLGVGWRASIVTYVVTRDGYLDATGWPLNGRIAHVSEIQRVTPSHDPRASHAASLDRLRIDFERRDRSAGLIFIAVQDEQGFLDALAARDPGLVRPQAGANRLERVEARQVPPRDGAAVDG